jgi:hypothetical protein
MIMDDATRVYTAAEVQAEQEIIAKHREHALAALVDMAVGKVDYLGDFAMTERRDLKTISREAGELVGVFGMIEREALRADQQRW